MDTFGQASHNANSNYQEACDFLNVLSTIEPNMLWESGRMSFWWHSAYADKSEAFFRDNARTWRNQNGEIVALCISEYGCDDMIIEDHPDYHGLYPAILDWAEGTWSTKRKKIDVYVCAEDAAEIEQLESRGFGFESHCENKRNYNLSQLDTSYQLEKGFSIRTMAESGDLERRVALTRNAFDNSSCTMERLTGQLASPDYCDDYHLMVILPDGQPGAYCVGWHETARAGFGYIEPVGTHADFRRRGFAKAVIQECFACLKGNGIHTVEIASGAEPNVPNVLYESLEANMKREAHKYSKAVNVS